MWKGKWYDEFADGIKDYLKELFGKLAVIRFHKDKFISGRFDFSIYKNLDDAKAIKNELKYIKNYMEFDYPKELETSYGARGYLPQDQFEEVMD